MPPCIESLQWDVKVKVKFAQMCPTLFDAMDYTCGLYMDIQELFRPEY